MLLTEDDDLETQGLEGCGLEPPLEESSWQTTCISSPRDSDLHFWEEELGRKTVQSGLERRLSGGSTCCIGVAEFGSTAPA